MFSCVEHGKSFITSGPELFSWGIIKGSNPSVLMNPSNPRVMLFFFTACVIPLFIRLYEEIIHDLQFMNFFSRADKPK